MIENFNLENEILKFRSALINYNLHYYRELVLYRNFPYGFCTNASKLFATYLVNELNFNKDTIYLISNGSYKCTQHTWLLIDDNIIDITIDQFPEYSKTSTFIFNKHSKFHSRYANQKEFNFADWFDTDERIYKNIIKLVSSSSHNFNI